MSRISRYQESISKFIKTKSTYSDLIKSNNKIEEIIKLNNHEASIILLTVLNGQYKKKNLKAHHGYYMASGIDLLMTNVIVNDDYNYYEIKYGKTMIKNIIVQFPIYATNCLIQNIDTLEIVAEKEKKLHSKLLTYLNTKMLTITKHEEFQSDIKATKTDIIKYKFNDKNTINKYKKINIIPKEKLLEYVNNTYGSVCQCSFIFGWLLGLGDEKVINKFEDIGNELGLMIKLSKDFKNLEKDILSANNTSTNLIVNLGICECFDLFNQTKILFLEGCMRLDVYNITIKEVIDNIEKTFDEYLENTDLDIASKFSSFSQ